MLVYRLVPGIFGNSVWVPFPLPLSVSLCSLSPPVPCAACPPLWAALPRHLPPASFHASHRSSSTPSSFALDLPSLRHAPAEASRGCHLAAAVARAAQHPGFPSCARLSTPGDPASQSTRPLARSLPQTRRTPPPPCVNPGELDAAAEPPLQLSSARADPLGSSAVGPRSSPTHPPLPIATRAPPRRSRPPPVTCFRGATSLLCLDPN